MNPKLETALTNVEMTYGELVEIANDMLKPLFDPINNLVLLKLLLLKLLLLL